MKVMLVIGQQGNHSYVEEAPTRLTRQWRCTSDSWVVAAPASPDQIDAFLNAVIQHSLPHAGPPPHIHQVHT